MLISVRLNVLIFLRILTSKSEADLGLLPAVNYYHKELHLGCCSSPRSASENAFILFLLPMKHSNLLMAKILPNVNNSLLGILGIWNISILHSRSIILYTSMGHPITSQIMTLKVLRSFFCA